MNVLESLRRALGFGATCSNAPATGDPARVAAVEGALADLRPMLALDGGDVALVGVADDGVVSVRFAGACTRCHARPTTLDQALAPALRERLGWVTAVRAV